MTGTSLFAAASSTRSSRSAGRILAFPSSTETKRPPVASACRRGRLLVGEVRRSPRQGRGLADAGEACIRAEMQLGEGDDAVADAEAPRRRADLGDRAGEHHSEDGPPGSPDPDGETQ